MLPIDKSKPVKFEGSGRAVTPELIQTFFKYGFHPAERKYKVLFLVLATTGLRISEVCAINIKDFLPDTGFTQFYVKIQKKQKVNFIATRVLPEPTAAMLRDWIKSNFTWIASKQGYIFPCPNNRGLHIRANNAQTFLGKKRKYLHSLFPEMNFLKIDKKTYYKKPKLNSYTGKMETEVDRYCFTSHSFRHFYSRHISQYPDEARKLLRQADMKTALLYRGEAELLELERKLANELFDEKFYDAVMNPADNAVCVWKN